MRKLNKRYKLHWPHWEASSIVKSIWNFKILKKIKLWKLSVANWELKFVFAQVSRKGANVENVNVKSVNIESVNVESANVESANVESANVESVRKLFMSKLLTSIIILKDNIKVENSNTVMA